jgi:hypothetical protein
MFCHNVFKKPRRSEGWGEGVWGSAVVVDGVIVVSPSTCGWGRFFIFGLNLSFGLNSGADMLAGVVVGKTIVIIMGVAVATLAGVPEASVVFKISGVDVGVPEATPKVALLPPIGAEGLEKECKTESQLWPEAAGTA